MFFSPLITGEISWQHLAPTATLPTLSREPHVGGEATPASDALSPWSPSMPPSFPKGAMPWLSHKCHISLERKVMATVMWHEQHGMRPESLLFLNDHGWIDSVG